MSDRQLFHIAAIVSAIADCGGTAPRSPVYLALGEDFSYFLALEGVMKRAGLITATSSTVRLTSLGHQKARELRALLEAPNN